MGDKNKLQNQGGFVIIVALGMVMIGIILMAILQSANLRTIRNLADYVNHDHAVAFANSGMEILQFELKNKGAGYTTGKLICTYGEYVAENTEGGGYSAICQDFDLLVGILDGEDKTNNVKIKAEIKGRATDGSNGTVNESFTSCSQYMPSGTASLGCYVVPFPGTGTAGKNCEFYTPDFAAGASGTGGEINIKTGKLAEAGLATDSKVSQIDYSCNWNKLQFGSSVIDRATIPLYYTADGGETVSPFSNDTVIGGGGASNSFVVRVRTPCKPVMDLATKKTETPVDCADDERYILEEDDGDDIVVQWQITGQCKQTAGSTEYEEECGMIQFGEYQSDEDLLPYFSAINEGRINYGSGTAYDSLFNDDQGADDTAHKLLYPILYAVDTSSYEAVGIGQKASGPASKSLKLPTMKNPTLSLFLSNKLISTDGTFVPYLEYQVLTSTPVSDSKIKMEVTVTFNGNTYKKTIYKEEQKPLIDFAIQN